MTRPIVPIASLQRRIPEAGRIRIGIRSGRAMKAIDTFRFTSPDRQAVEQIAAVYGGEVREWSDPKAAPGQHEVITTANEIRVVLPPDCLGGTPIYEHWTGGGCDRRCDGLNCTQIVKGPDGAEQVEVPCLCQAEGALACDPHTRLSVLLPDVRFTGVWRLDSKSWNVAQEMPGFVEVITSMQERGLIRAVLRLEHRRSVSAGETRKYVVPVLGIADSMDEIVAGAARVASLGAGSSVPAGELEAGEGPVGDDGAGLLAAASSSPASPLDDEVIDAEIVDNRTLADVLPANVTDARALVAARHVLGSHITATEQVTDYRDIARVLDALSSDEVHA